MTWFILAHLLLTICWLILTGDFGIANIVIAAILGFILMWLIAPWTQTKIYVQKLKNIVQFIFHYIAAMWVSNLQVAYDIVTPTHYMEPEIIDFPMQAKTPLEMVLLANLISMTPGSLSIDIDPSTRQLKIHIMYMRDKATTIAELKQFEQELLGITRT